MTQFDISRQNMIKARENYNSNKLRLKIELQNAENLLQAQISNQRDYAILSVLDGKVYDVTPNVGDLVNSQLPLMEIGDSAKFETELSVDETDVGLIKPGQNISYTIDAFPDQIFHGTVNEIFPHINSSSKTSRIKATFESEESKSFFTGMSIEANIVISEKKNVLTVKREFVTKDKTVSLKGQDKPVKVTLGAEDLEYVEILSGIKEDDVLTK
jgi:multidrug efflux pump subunit AcrA (membrane-fusion protein)